MFKVNNKNTERRQWRYSGVLTIIFQHISHLFLSIVSIVDPEQVNFSWVPSR